MAIFQLSTPPCFAYSISRIYNIGTVDYGPIFDSKIAIYYRDSLFRYG